LLIGDCPSNIDFIINSMILERLQVIITEVSEDLVFIVGDDFDANRASTEVDPLTKDFAIFNDRTINPIEIDKANVIHEVLPINMMFLTGDTLDASAIESGLKIEKMRVLARRFLSSLNQDKILRDTSRAVEAATLTVMKKSYEGVLTGVRLECEFPIRADYDACFSDTFNP